jgi:hypothetical protein
LAYIGYTNGIIHKVQKSPYKSVQKGKLADIILLLQEMSTSFNVVTDSQYCYFAIKHVVTAYIPHDNSNDLFFLFHQLQDILLSCNTLIFITHIRAHSQFPGPMTKGNNDTDPLLISPPLLEADQYHNQTHADWRHLKQ